MANFVFLKRFLHRHRLQGKRIIAALSGVLPARIHSRLKSLAEQVAFRVVPAYQGETLPRIFHYWSNRYLRPVLNTHGFESPEDFYLVSINKAAASKERRLRVLSLGSGSCALEIGLIERLRAGGVDLHVECVDMNRELMRLAAENARARGVDDAMSFTTADCNRYRCQQSMDVIVVNQFFHHVSELEQFCAVIRDGLSEDGVLLTSDVIGRNGHMLWPAVDVAVQRHWISLPESKRFDRYHDKATASYISVDHAAYSNEGIRAQDIVACLSDCFDFELFLSYGGTIMPFIERRIGFNFDPDEAGDRAFIDAVASEDAAAIADGAYPASNMLAVLRHRGCAKNPVTHHPITPYAHAKATEIQKRI